MWPVSLQQLAVGSNFNQSIAGFVRPASRQQLSFGWNSTSRLSESWPAPLQEQTYFNQPTAVRVVCPAPLQELTFGWKFNQPIVGVVWPTSLQQLSFG